MPPAKQSQPKSVPAQPEKRNFQKCPTHDKKEEKFRGLTKMEFLTG
jgi:hypothetical protein